MSSRPASLFSNKTGDYLTWAAFLLVAGTLVTWTSIKADSASFTHDESYTYLNYPKQTFMQIISLADWYPNNHLLNSLFMKYSEMAFGNGELALRLPNVLALVIFLTYGFLMLRGSPGLFRVSVVALLGTNVLLADLFCMARGYGLSCGFLLMGLYHLLASFESRRTRNIIFFHLGMVLATMSSFPMLTVYVSLLFLHNLYPLVLRWAGDPVSWWRWSRAHLVPFLAAVAVLYEPVRRILGNELDFGGSQGLVADTLTQLIGNSLHYAALSDWQLLLLQAVFVGILFSGTVVCVVQLVRKNHTFFREHVGLVFFNGLLQALWIIFVLQHLILGNDYPVGRFSAFLFPLFLLHLVFLLRFVAHGQPMQWVAPGMATLALVSVISFATWSNFHSLAEWGYDRYTRDAFEVMLDDKKALGIDGQAEVWPDWLYQPTLDFYMATHPEESLVFERKADELAQVRYYYLADSALYTVNGVETELVRNFPETRTSLLRHFPDQTSSP